METAEDSAAKYTKDEHADAERLLREIAGLPPEIGDKMTGAGPIARWGPLTYKLGKLPWATPRVRTLGELKKNDAREFMAAEVEGFSHGDIPDEGHMGHGSAVDRALKGRPWRIAYWLAGSGWFPVQKRKRLL